ncbi:hypothetical protein EI94DRAFT_1831177, partial [Lactarius quietus]
MEYVIPVSNTLTRSTLIAFLLSAIGCGSIWATATKLLPQDSLRRRREPTLDDSFGWKPRSVDIGEFRDKFIHAASDTQSTGNCKMGVSRV